MTPSLPEVWQRGPIPGITALLQPVAHALLQAREELDQMMTDFPDHLLWEKPSGVASVGFHLQHLSGVLDRLFTYVRGEKLDNQQRVALAAEALAENPDVSVSVLLERFHLQVENALEQLRNTAAETLTDFRGIGEKQLPSNVLGLLFHATEHTMRHIGQLHVTAKIVRG